MTGPSSTLATSSGPVCPAFFLALLIPATSLSLADEIGIRWEETTSPAGGAKGFVELIDGSILAARTFRGEDGARVVCSKSGDGGRSFSQLGVITHDPNRRTDLGDGHLIQLRDRRLLYSYRHNHYRGTHADRPSFSIRVAVSNDGGKTWSDHSTVQRVDSDTGRHPSRGLWASFLLEKRDGSLQCYYDDENAAYAAGRPGHQWLRMKTFERTSGQWIEPVTVCRTTDPSHLARDGMASVVELPDGRLPDGRLLCAVESCDVTPPHPNLIRQVTSTDGGKTWSTRREILYRPAKPNHMAVSPWICRLTDGTLICVFATDEDRSAPDKPGTPVWRLNMDLKYVISTDDAQHWSSGAETIYNGSHKSYMPGIAQLRNGRHAGSLLVLFYDTKHGYLGKRGRIRQDGKTTGDPP